MVVHIFLFILFFSLLIWHNKHNAFFINSGLTTKQIFFLFVLKVTIGILYIYIDQNFIYRGDLDTFYTESIYETNLLLSDPKEFFTSFFISDIGYSNFFYTDSFWNNFRNVFLYELLAVFNLLSFKNIYINSLLYNYLIFYGHVLLFKVFCMVWPTKKTAILIGCFLLPSSLFYLSGINKDSIFFLGMAITLYSICLLFVLKKKSVNVFILLLLGLTLTVIIRNFFFVLFLPTTIALIFSIKYKTYSYKIVAVIFGVCILIFLCSPLLMEIVSTRQHDFLALGWAKSALKVDVLQPTFTSFITYFPTALNIAFFRPYIWDSYSIFYFAGALETLLLLIFILLTLFYAKSTRIFTQLKSPIILFCIFYGVAAILIIGYSIPILGASVRYKTAFLPLLFTPLLCIFPFYKITWLYKIYTTYKKYLVA